MLVDMPNCIHMTLIQNLVGVGQSQEPNGHADVETQITTEDNPVKTKSKKQAKCKKVARRGLGFSKGVRLLKRRGQGHMLYLFKHQQRPNHRSEPEQWRVLQKDS